MTKQADQLRELTLGLAPDPAEPASAGPAARPASRPRRVAAMPAEQPAEPRWGGPGAQINLTVDREMKRALARAQLDDGIETTARIRAMIALYLEDPRLAVKVNERARLLKGRNRPK
jgi:hypothetical protein